MQLKKELIDRDYSKLPQEYWQKQNLCWYLHDVIMSMFTEIINKDLIKIRITLKEDNEDFDKYDNTLDWLKKTGRNTEFTTIVCKDLFMRLLSDFLNHIYEVLSNLERGKIAIAFELLRKPFKDNLLYMEWILFNDIELSNLVYDGEIDKYAQGKSKLNKDYIQKIVLYNVSNNRFINEFHNKGLEESIYNIRYNYNSPYSLELMWNKATHLVTTSKKIRSEDFNFIYNNEFDYNGNWKYLYGKIPILLLYTIGIVENIYDKYFQQISSTVKKYNFLLILGKFLASNDDTLKSGDYLLNIIDGKLYLPCEHCKKIITLRKPESYVFYNYFNVICPDCKKEFNICKYFFFNEHDTK